MAERRFEYVDPVPADLLCPVCQQPFISPLRIRSCGHTFCDTCLAGQRQCPLDGCSTPDREPADRIVRNLLDALRVRCPHSGCGHVCKRASLPDHLFVNHAKKFMLSGFKGKRKKQQLQECIAALGGTIVHDATLEWTHLIAEKLTKCEKVLASMAGGKWILTEQYVTLSHLAGHWLLEDVHEWTGAQCDSKVEREVAMQARHWRLSGGRPFVGWRCVLYTEGHNHFSRILEKGTAAVLPPADIRRATHVFFDQKHCRQVLATKLFPLVNEDLADIWYLNTDFILATLLKEMPDPSLWKATLLLRSKRARSPTLEEVQDGTRRARDRSSAAQSSRTLCGAEAQPIADALFHEFWEG
eukprot:GGOE01061670.1.p1 GENE.GGOE01061670.1~~GGOE01061670.1.p1  ORF type:complete len:386 (-),score=104.53 GGOE01061670.1:197-1264(-)